MTSQPTISADQHLDPELERDVVDVVARAARSAARAATRTRPSPARWRRPATSAAHDPVAQRRLDQREEEELARPASPARSCRSGRRRRRPRSRRRAPRARARRCAARDQLAAAEQEEHDAPTAKQRRRDPGPALVAGRVAVPTRDLEERERDGDEPDPGDPALDVAQPPSSPSCRSSSRAQRPLRVLAQQRVVAAA